MSHSTPSPRELVFKNLDKSYPESASERVVLRGVNESIRPGEIVVLLGRSGSGKSTLLNLISGIDKPSRGEIWAGETCLTALDEQQFTLFRRRHIGFIFQFFNLIPTLTVMENLLLPLELNGQSGPRAVERALSLLGEVGLADRAQAFPDRLSGGEQQRVAVVRALVHEPALILADEPTGNLDYENGLQVVGLLDRLVRQHGATMIMATHSREVIGIADRILQIRDGHLEPLTSDEAQQPARRNQPPEIEARGDLGGR